MRGAPVLITDSCSDLPDELVESLGLEVLDFPYTLAGEEHKDGRERTQSLSEFYSAMRSGDHPTTAQIPRSAFVDAFRAHAAAGEPVLYLGFSSALSANFDVAWLARRDVLEEFPDAEIRLVDTRAAAVAEGLLVYEAARMWRAGAAIEDVESWVGRERPRLNGWFIVDDLETLRRGGRLPGAVAAAGTLLDVKPILCLTTEGKLELRRSVRGRGKAIRALADLAAERINDSASQTIAVAHGDCAEDAARLATALTERMDVQDIITMEVGPVIGTHTGPGMLAVVFWGAPQ